MLKKIAPVLFCFALQIGNAQNPSNSGTDFWLGFMDLISNYRIYITSEVNTSGTLTIPLTGFTQPFTVNANGCTEIPLTTNQVRANSSDTIENLGVHIVANDAVCVQFTTPNGYFAEAAAVYPVTSLGTAYYAASYSSGGGFAYSQFIIVATDNNTSVQVTVTDTTLGGHVPNVPFSFNINTGEVMQLKSYFGDLTGSYITSNKPVAVFSGHQCADVPVNSSYCNPIHEQLIPVSKMGYHFITTPLQSRLNGDVFRVIATQNNTALTINGAFVATINAGAFYETILTNASEIVSSSPVTVMQYSHSGSFDGVSFSDPFMVTITPIDRLTNKAVFFTDSLGNIQNDFYENIVTTAANTGLVTLDGNVLGSALFAAIPGTPYAYAGITLNQGFHTLVSDSGFAAIAYGFGISDGFGYSLNDISASPASGLVNHTAQTVAVTVAPAVFSIYTTVYFHQPSQSGYCVQLADIYGRIVFNKANISAPQLTLPRGTLAAGTYNLLVSEQGVIKATAKVCIVRQ